MSYLVFVAYLGAAAVIFLWLRDARIYYRTGLPGYRKAAYYGVLYGAMATLGGSLAATFDAAAAAAPTPEAASGALNCEVVGLGLIVLAVYLQGLHKKERVWTTEPVLDRALGSVPVRKGIRDDRQ
jgi:hypothetical protein